MQRLVQADQKMTDTGKVRERKRVETPVAASATAVNGTSQFVSESQDGNVNSVSDRMAISKERQSLVLWRRPLTTLYYFVLEIGMLVRKLGIK